MAPGTSQTTCLCARMRVAADGAEYSPLPMPPRSYWTLIGYFNSLRVLGGARMQVHDDVEDRIKQISSERGSRPRPVDKVIELTSREPIGRHPRAPQQMRESFPAPDVLDVVLATNMISVGVDINRLGLMVVMGQPQGTSEYIQATSRVGRQFRGWSSSS